MAEGVVAQQVPGGVLAERRQRVISLHPPLGEEVGPARAQRDRPVLGAAHHDPPDALVVAQRLDQPGVRRLDLLERHPLVGGGEGHEAQVAGGQDDGGGARVGLGRRDDLALGERVLGAVVDGHHAVLHPAAGGAAQHARAGAVPAGGLRERDAEGGAALVGPHRRPHATLDGAVDEVLEGAAVALQEGGALALAVVGQDDEVVRAGRQRAGAVQPGDLAVELLEDLERVGPGDPGVVGDLVVGHERRVGHGDPHVHVGHQRGHVEVAAHDGLRHAQERVDPAAARLAQPGQLVRALLGARRPLLADDVHHAEGQGADEPVRLAEVGEEVRARLAALDEDRAHGGQRARRVAGHEVADRRAVDGQQPGSVGVAALDLLGVLGVVGDHDAASVLLVPAEAGHVDVAAQQQAGLAGAGLRGQVALPPHDLVRPLLEPARHVRQVPAVQRLAQRLLPQPVDLEEDHPGDVACADAAGAAGAAADDAHVDRLAVRVEQRLQHGGHHGHDDRDADRGSRAADDVRQDLGGQPHHEPVEDERGQEHEDDRQAQRQADEDRPQQGVEDRDHQGQLDRADEGAHLETGEDPGHRHEDEADDGQGDREAHQFLDPVRHPVPGGVHASPGARMPASCAICRSYRSRAASSTSV